MKQERTVNDRLSIRGGSLYHLVDVKFGLKFFIIKKLCLFFSLSAYNVSSTFVLKQVPFGLSARQLRHNLIQSSCYR